MRILITRPEVQADRTAKALAELGHSYVIEPLLLIESIETPVPAGNFDGLVLTSTNALPTLNATWPQEDRAEIPLMTTGAATAQAAKNLGFVKSQHVAGSALDLIDEIPNWMAQNGLPTDARLLYPCAETVAHDISHHLSKNNIQCDRWIVYRSSPAAQFSLSTQNALKRGEIDGVLLYSKRTAHTFVQLMQQHKIPMSGLRIYVLSREILQSLPDTLKNLARSAEQPEESELLRQIGT